MKTFINNDVKSFCDQVIVVFDKQANLETQRFLKNILTKNRAQIRREKETYRRYYKEK